MDATGVFLGDALTNGIIIVLAGLYLLRGTWTENVVETDPDSDSSVEATDRPISTNSGFEDED